ncbi:MAG: hypothetical protein QOI03_1981 [Solirubrobacteraceae bacterium]|nr:hypothetical protein [Solirubrobacteraceae bacterium]
MLGLLARLLRIAAFIICLIVIASFLVFAVDQTKSASSHQQAQLQGTPESASTGKVTHESSVHKTLDEASDKLTSPFSGIVASSSSQWLIRSTKLLLALLVYGFGLGYLARVIRMRF